jgi:hypothetical protein
MNHESVFLKAFFLKHTHILKKEDMMNRSFYTAVLFCGFLLLGCSKESNNPIVTHDQISNQGVVSSTYYKYGDQTYKVDVTRTPAGTEQVIQNGDYEAVKRIMDDPNSGFFPQPDNDTVLLWIGSQEANQVMDNFKLRSGLAKRSYSPSVVLYRDANLGGSSVSLSQSNPNLGALGFNDITSSMQYVHLYTAIIYENSNYSGHSLGLGFINTDMGVIGTLASYCMIKILWWCGTSWNDQMSSISF